MPIGTGIIYNVGDLILSQVSGSGNTFLETKIAAATSSIVYFDSTARINSASLNSITVGTASYVSGSNSIVTNFTASNISASGTSSFGYVGIGTSSPADKLSVISGSTRIASTALAGALYLGNDGSNIYLQRDNSYDLSLVQNGDSNSALYLASAGSVYVNIDSNNNDTDKAFIVQNNALKAGTELFRVSETGNVGIGTSIPSQKLHIKSTDTFAAIKFTNSVSDAGIISYSSDNLYFYTANAQRITIDTAGNVGIGTTAPAYLLDVSGSSRHGYRTADNHYFTGSVNISGSLNATASWSTNALTASFLPVGTYNITSSWSTNALTASSVSSTSNAFIRGGNSFGANAMLGLNDNFRLDIETNGVALISLTGSNVGIGTTSPGTLFQVFKAANGNNWSWFNGNVGANLPTGFTTGVAIGANYSNGLSEANLIWGHGVSSNQYFAIGKVSGSTSYSEQLRIDINGNVGIGTTTPNNKLHVYNSAGSSTTASNAIAIFEQNSNAGIQVCVPDASEAGLFFSRNGAAYYSAVTRNGTDLLLKNGSSTAVTINSSRYVGIGTSSPSYILHVNAGVTEVAAQSVAAFEKQSSTDGRIALFSNSTGSGYSSYIYIGSNPGRDWKIGKNVLNSGTTGHFQITNDLNALKMQINASDESIIFPSGSVGIGTTAPAYLLDVSGSSRHGYRAADTHQFTGSVSVSGSVTAASFTGSLSGSITSALTASYLTPANSYTITNLTASNISASLTGSFGLVGIGTSSPGYTLEVNGTQRVVGNFYLFNTVVNPASNFANQRGVGFEASTGKLEVAASGSPALAIGRYGSTGQILDFRYAGTQIGYFSLDTNDLTLGTARHLILSPTGNVGIGTSSPAQKLEVQSGSVLIRGDGNALFGTYYASAGENTFFTLHSGSGNTFHIGNDVSGTNYNTMVFTAATDTTGGKVGIGTSSPGSKLQINDNTPVLTIRANDGGTSRKAYIDFYTTFFNYPSDVGARRTSTIVTGFDSGVWGTEFLAFNVGSGSANDAALLPIERVRIDGSGNLGVGTTNPVAKLQVAGNISGSSFTSSISNAVGFLGTSSWANNVVSASYATTAQTANALNTGNSYTITNLTASNISASATGSFGYVGIGTTSPNSKLTITQTAGADSVLLELQSNNDPGIRFGRSTYGSLIRHISATVDYIAFNCNGTSQPSTAATAQVVFDESGNVGIGTTSPTQKLHIQNGYLLIDTNAAVGSGIWMPDTNGNPSLRIVTDQSDASYTSIINNWGSNTNSGVMVGTVRSDGTAFQVRSGVTVTSGFANADGTTRFIVNGDGNVGIGTVTPAAKLEISGSSNSVLLNIKSPISGAILYVSGSGAVGIGTSNVGAYTLQVNGSFAATTKSFVIEHPTKAGKKLIYGSLESPYHGIRLTGKDTLKEGKCKIQLPDYIYKLILHDSVNIQLTGIKCNKTLYIDDINVPENYFTIAYDKTVFESYKTYDFFWDFTAIRADVPELQTEM